MKLGHKTSDFSPRFRHPTSNISLQTSFSLHTSAFVSAFRHQTSDIKQPLGSNHSASSHTLSILASMGKGRLKRK